MHESGELIVLCAIITNTVMCSFGVPQKQGPEVIRYNSVSKKTKAKNGLGSDVSGRLYFENM